MWQRRQREPRGRDRETQMTDRGPSNGAELRGETLLSSIMKPEGPEECRLMRNSNPTEERPSVSESQTIKEGVGDLVHATYRPRVSWSQEEMMKMRWRKIDGRGERRWEKTKDDKKQREWGKDRKEMKENKEGGVKGKENETRRRGRFEMRQEKGNETRTKDREIRGGGRGRERRGHNMMRSRVEEERIEER